MEDETGIRAVVFDFFGTLTVSATADTRRQGAAEVAQALGVPADVYFEQVTSTFTERATGSCGDLAATMAWIAERCGNRPDPDQLASACAVRRTVEARYAQMVRPETHDTLSRLARHGLTIGVVSDCTHELPEYWPELPFAGLVDAAVFSVEEGARKPDPSLYRAVCHRLSVEPKHTVYVGDGGSNELSGASAVGMRAVQLVAPDAVDALVYDAEEGWTGPVIAGLDELLPHLE